MYLKELEYIVTIADEKSITAAANKLFITPPALAQQLKTLEKNVGAALFLRSKAGCTPTQAGEIYIKAAREMLQKKQQVYREIKEIKNWEESYISVCFPPQRGSGLIYSIYDQFHTQYPNVEIRLIEASVHDQQQMIANGEIDLGFQSLMDSQKTDDIYIDLSYEEVLMVAPAAWFPDKKNMDFILRDEIVGKPFALMYGNSTLRTIQDQVLEKMNLHPRVIMTSTRNSTILDMAAKGYCLGLVGDYYYTEDRPEIRFFRLSDKPMWKWSVSYKKDSYLSKAARIFIDLARQYYQ